MAVQTRRPNRGKQLPPIALASTLAREEGLPAPLAYYPGRQGTFIAFAASREAPPALCACTEGAVRNLLRLGGLEPGLFPDLLAGAAAKQDLSAFFFRKGLCHRCNLTAPTVRYCHELNGTQFVQTYGWYINQTYLRLGIHPETHRYLPEVCPSDYVEVLGRIDALAGQARDARARLVALMNDPRSAAAGSDRAPLEAALQQMNKPRYDLRRMVENITRAEFGVRAIGEGWVSETQLYQIICGMFPGEQVLRRHRPDWMEGLELDLYLPERRAALEYQGQQHFYPVRVWGGEQALAQVQARDSRKVELCRQAGVRLIIIDFTEPLTEEHIQARLSPNSSPA
ncbi:MAG: hypothetical protein K0R39_2355 [Symbiobacteriaceae bacterium]|jgi:hypothetical protein|nr:hypothetical protein [Symbiobacteriaceae bacterium]